MIFTALVTNEKLAWFDFSWTRAAVILEVKGGDNYWCRVLGLQVFQGKSMFCSTSQSCTKEMYSVRILSEKTIQQVLWDDLRLHHV